MCDLIRSLGGPHANQLANSCCREQHGGQGTTPRIVQLFISEILRVV